MNMQKYIVINKNGANLDEILDIFSKLFFFGFMSKLKR
jgi:hypothetical protein